VARVSATHKRDQTVAGPPQSPREKERRGGGERFIDINRWLKEREKFIAKRPTIEAKET
jgi:hypothetical protein